MEFVSLAVYLVLGISAAFLARRFMDFKDEKVLAALFIAVPLLAMLGTGKLTKVSAFGVEAVIEKVRTEKVADTALGQQKLKDVKGMLKASADAGKVTMADGFFGVRKQIIVLDADSDLVKDLQPLPDYQLQVPDQCYASFLKGEEKATVDRLIQASHTLASVVQESLKAEGFAGVAVVSKGVLQAYFAPSRFLDLAGLRLVYTHYGVALPQVPCALVGPLSQTAVWEILRNPKDLKDSSDRIETVSTRSTFGELLRKLDEGKSLTLALVDEDGRFKGVVNRADVAVSALARLVNSN